MIFASYTSDFWHLRKFYNFDQYNVLLTIASNKPVLLMTGLVVQSPDRPGSHILIIYCLFAALFVGVLNRRHLRSLFMIEFVIFNPVITLIKSRCIKSTTVHGSPVTCAADGFA